MQKIWKTVFFLLVGGFMTVCPALAEEMSTAELRQELEAMKKRIAQLEALLSAPSPSSDTEAGTEATDRHADRTGVLGLPERVRRMEEMEEMDQGDGDWTERLTISGLIEVEASYQNTDFDESGVDDEDSSDLTLATVELGVDAKVAKHVGSHVLFLFEEEDDDDDGVEIDEAFIILDGEDVVPLYLNAGRMYVPFGYFETYFISDPLTLEIGETQETAVKVGFANEMAELNLSVFKGDIDGSGDDDHIDSWTVGATFTAPEDLLPNWGLMLGTSFISNIADSDELTDALDTEFGVDEIDDEVYGAHAFLSLSFQERVFLVAEYVTALDDIEPEGSTEKFQPSAWNVELAFVPVEDWEVGLRYESSDETLNLLPESQFGGVVSYQLFDNTTLAFEYLHGKFENDDETDLLTSQMAIEF